MLNIYTCVYSTHSGKEREVQLDSNIALAVRSAEVTQWKWEKCYIKIIYSFPRIEAERWNLWILWSPFDLKFTFWIQQTFALVSATTHISAWWKNVKTHFRVEHDNDKDDKHDSGISAHTLRLMLIFMSCLDVGDGLKWQPTRGRSHIVVSHRSRRRNQCWKVS